MSIKDELRELLAQWNSTSPTMTVHTSGSTGKPKAIEVEKVRMLASARTTCDYLGLKPGDTALLCMPLRYIAGIMMVVRALERGLVLAIVEPNGKPFGTVAQARTNHGGEAQGTAAQARTNNDGTVLTCLDGRSGEVMEAAFSHFDLVAMVPLQVWNTLQDTTQTLWLERTRNLIIGGGAIDHNLEAQLCGLCNEKKRRRELSVYSTYGMTETLSHIALRRIGEPWYHTLPGISIAQNNEGCLIIDAPALCAEQLVTNDIVEMKEMRGKEKDKIEKEEQREDRGKVKDEEQACGQLFRILGRRDNTICSGGIKIQIEEVEAVLRPVFGDTIQVTSVPHPKFGEVVVYLTTEEIDEHLLRLCITNPYWLPKKIRKVDHLPKTETGKPDRAKAKEMALQR